MADLQEEIQAGGGLAAAARIDRLIAV